MTPMSLASASAHEASTHNVGHIKRQLRCQALEFGPLLDHHTVRAGRRTHGSLDTSDDGLCPGRALATSARFFAMTTGATGGDPEPGRPWRPQTPQWPLTPQRDRLEPHVVDPSWAACLAGNGTPDVMKSTPRTMPRAQAQCTVWCRRNVPTFGNPALTRPTAWYRKASGVVPSYTLGEVFLHRVPMLRSCPRFLRGRTLQFRRCSAREMPSQIGELWRKPGLGSCSV